MLITPPLEASDRTDKRPGDLEQKDSSGLEGRVSREKKAPAFRSQDVNGSALTNAAWFKRPWSKIKSFRRVGCANCGIKKTKVFHTSQNLRHISGSNGFAFAHFSPN